MEEKSGIEKKNSAQMNEIPDVLKKRGFWESLPNKRQFVLGVLVYLLGLVLALVGSSAKSLAKPAQATVTQTALSPNGQNVYIVSYEFETARGKTILDSYAFWTVKPEEDLPKVGGKIEINYLPFLPTMAGNEQTWSFVMFAGIMLFFAGWTMTKGRAPIVQTRKKKSTRDPEKYYYPPEESSSEALPGETADAPPSSPDSDSGDK
jgi:hypothetical protein